MLSEKASEWFSTVRSSASPKRIIYLLIVVGFITFVYWARPVYQELVMAIIFNPWLILIPVLAIGIALFGFAVYKKYGSSSGILTPEVIGTVSTVLFCIGLVVILSLAGAAEDKAMNEKHEFENTDSLMETNPDYIRGVTLAEGQTYTENSFQYQRHKTGEGNIVDHDGTPHWSFPAETENLYNSLTDEQRGVILVDQSSDERSVKAVDTTVERGAGMFMWRNSEWQMKKNAYFHVYEDETHVPHDGDVYPYSSTYEPDYELAWGFFPVAVPQWSGVSVVDQYEVTHYSPEEAQNQPVLENQPIYSTTVSRAYVEAQRMKNGLTAYYLSNEGLPQVAPVDQADNDQPFIIKTNNGYKHVIAAEPAGSGGGVFQIWTFDARTGESNVYDVSGEALVGPERSLQYVRSEDPQMFQTDQYRAEEPIPMNINGKLYWFVRVVSTGDNNVLSHAAFVDAEDRNTYTVDNIELAKEFARGNVTVTEDGEVKQIDSQTIIRINKDGETTEYILENGDSLEVTVQEESGSDNEDSGS